MTGAIIGSAVLGVGATIYASDQASSSAEAAAEVSADSQNAALEYLMEVEALPREIRENALTYLAGIYGIGGVDSMTGLAESEYSQQDLIDQAESSPLYAAIMGGQQEGEESILRSASATGGLRSGNVNEALYDYNVALSNSALLESYNQQLSGLSGLASLSSYASEIAGLQTGIGETQAAGITAASQAEQQGWGDVTGITTDAILSLGSTWDD